MVTFIVIGGVGLLMLLVSLVLDDLLELGDGLVSGTSLGAGLVAFGALGSIVKANGLATGWAYAAAIAFGLLVLFGVQAVVKRLKESEDGAPRVLTGVQGVVTATITGAGAGEVSLDDPRELERRLAWADTQIEVGTRIVVLEQSGSRVKVAPVTPTTPTPPAAGPAPAERAPEEQPPSGQAPEPPATTD
jgi:membrane protein implicated in regulation of membrane protease activity